MYELIQIGKNSFYMDCPSKVGFYRVSENEVVLIDSGSDKDSAKKAKRIIDSEGWSLRAIYDTHAHADHIGGNSYLQTQTGCRVYAFGADASVTENPIIGPTMIYGGFAMKEMHNKFLLASGCSVTKMTKDSLPCGMEMIHLPGHTFDMVGFRTDDNVVYLADAMSGRETLEKYRIGVLYDVREYLNTLEKIKEMKADAFVLSHADTCSDIVPLAQYNIDKTKEIAKTVRNLISGGKTLDELIKDIFDFYGLTMTLQQRMLLGYTVKSYLAFLRDEGEAEIVFEDNRMIWKSDV